MQPSVLIVDDEQNTAAMLQKLLSRQGYDTSAKNSYEDAVAVLETTTFDLALIDFIMPGNGGVALAKHVAEHFPAMGIIIISGMPTADLGRELIGIADDYVDKAQVTTPLVPLA